MNRPTRVIVVDDDEDTIELFTEFLGMRGIKVVGIGKNGKDALDLYKKHQPDAVLLDVMMPEYDGFFGLEKIKECNPEAKVIMVTADLTDETYRKLESLNASAILYKPYDIENLIQTIKNIDHLEEKKTIVISQ